MRRPLGAAAFALQALLLAGSARSAVVVEEVKPRWGADRAGLRPGDVLVSWTRAANGTANPRPASGDFERFLDLAELELEEAPRGRVTLRVLRRGKALSLPMAAGDWGATCRPEASESDHAAWLLLGAIERYAKEKRWAEAHAAANALLATLEGAAPSALRARALRLDGATFEAEGRSADAERRYREVLDVRSALLTGGLGEAFGWDLLGAVLENRDAAASRRYRQRSLARAEEVAPRSLAVVNALNQLAGSHLDRLELDEAEKLAARGLALAARVDTVGIATARLRRTLSSVARRRGDFGKAERLLRASLAALERLGADERELAATLNALGILADNRGDLTAAEELFRRSLALHERSLPAPLDFARTLANLANLANRRRDEETAEALYRRGLELVEKAAPGGIPHALALGSLGDTLRERGRVDEALALEKRAIAILEKEAPGSARAGFLFSYYAAALADAGREEESEEYLDRMLRVFRRLDANPQSVAWGLTELGAAAVRGGRLEAAEIVARETLALARRQNVGLYEANAWKILADVERRRGCVLDALAAYEASIATLEGILGRLGGSDAVRAGFRSFYETYFDDYLGLLAEAGREAEALALFERSRAGEILRLLAERNLVFGADVPAAALEALRVVDAEDAKLREEEAGLDPLRARERLEAVGRRRAVLRQDRAAAVRRLTQASPRFASLRLPRPLRLSAARAALDPGTVWLAYAIGKERSFLFVVTAAGAEAGDGLHVLRLPLAEADLRHDVELFRGLVLRGREAREIEPALVSAGARLYAALVKPAEAWIGPAKRLLISPDGPLHALPFGALVRDASGPGFLAEWKPLHAVQSATLYAELKRSRPRRREGATLVAFGDPKLPGAPAGGERSGSASEPALRRYRGGLVAIPASRDEARAVAAPFGSAATVYLGVAATEEAVRSAARGARYVHFATHALLDAARPLDSGLALAAPPASGAAGAGPGEDGLLQAWEVFDSLRLDADLVTLSACETALGKEAAGEGLLGLTRAFHYAGARSVLSSLWSVSDRSTVELMAAFYEALGRGATKDAALREAQRKLRVNGRTAHPYHWAGFALAGDWR